MFCIYLNIFICTKHNFPSAGSFYRGRVQVYGFTVQIRSARVVVMRVKRECVCVWGGRRASIARCRLSMSSAWTATVPSCPPGLITGLTDGRREVAHGAADRPAPWSSSAG